jgi:hypothetical protein
MVSRRTPIRENLDSSIDGAELKVEKFVDEHGMRLLSLEFY